MAGTKSKTKQKATSSGKSAVSSVKKIRYEVVREEIKDALKQIEEGFIDLSQLLSESYHKEFYVNWGFDTFDDYCKEELDIKYRKAMYFVDIWDKVKALKLNPRTVQNLGWTKMKEIVTVINEENAKEWLEKAKKMTSRELVEAVKIVRQKDTAGTAVPVVTTMSLKMSESEANIITESIEEAKKLCQTDNAVVALEMICQDWLAEKGATPERTTLQDMIRYVEKTYGVKVTTKKGKTTKKSAAKEKATDKASGKGKGAANEDLAGEETDPDLSDIFGLDD